MSVGSRIAQPDEDSTQSSQPNASDWQAQLDTFVGREREMQILQSRIDEATNGRGSLVLVSGEPGIGKTRLLTEASRYAESKKMQVLWGRCWEGEGAPAFWPWVQVLRSCVELSTKSDLGDAPTVIGQSALNQLTSTEPTEDTKIDGVAQFKLFDSISQALRLASRVSPLVVFLDDLHQADPSSVRVLEFILSELGQTRSTIVASVRRMTGTDQKGPLADRLGGDPNLVLLDLLGLSDQAAGLLMSSHLGGKHLTKLEVRSIQSRTEGNPFFLVETCQALRTSPEINLPPVLNVPASARILVDQRLSALPPKGRELLMRAAVIGRTFEHSLVHNQGEDPQETSCNLRLAETLGVVTPTRSRPGEYQFSHALIREALYGALPLEQREYLHSILATQIERSSASFVDDHIDTLANHYYWAGEQAPTGKALKYTLKAAARAKATAAYEYAAELLRRSLSLIHGDDALSVDVLLQLGSALLASGRWQESREIFLGAAATARTLGENARFAEAAIGAKGMILSPAPPDQRSIDLLQEALDRLPAKEMKLRVQVLHGLATATYFSPPRSSCTHLANEALELAKQVGDSQTLATGLEAVIMSLWRPGTAAAMIEYAKQLLELGRTSRNVELEGRARIHLYVSRAQRSDTTAESEIDLAENLAERSNHPKLRWQISLLRSSQALARGDFESGLKFAESASKLGRKCHDQTASIHLGLNLLLRARLCGSFEGLEGYIRDGARLTPDVPLSKLATLCIDYASDPAAQRRRALSETLEACQLFLHSNAFSLWAQCILAELSFLGDAPDVAFKLMQGLDAHSEESVVAGWGTAIEGSTAHFAGLARLALGENEKARSCFQRAEQVNGECNWSLLRARSQIYLGLASSRSDGGEAAADTVTAGRRAYERTGANLFDNPFIVGAQGSHLHDCFSALLNERTTATLGERTPRREATATRDGEFISISYESSAVQIRATKGVRQLAWLVENPGADIPSALLATIDNPDSANPDRRNYEPKASLIDRRARQDYVQRVREIRSLMDRPSSDPAQNIELREELEWLTKVLNQSRRRGGQDRFFSDRDERARISVRNNIANAIKRIHRTSSKLGAHLMNSIRTGSVCSYRPE